MINTCLKFLPITAISLFIVSCKNEERGEIKANLKNITDILDTMEFKVTFVPLATDSIVDRMRNILKRNATLPPLNSELTDSSTIESCLEQLARTTVYMNWANGLGIRSAKEKGFKQSVGAFECFSLQSIDSEWKKNKSVDSLNQSLIDFFSQDSMIQESAYFNAVYWLENLFLTLSFEAKISNPSEYHRLILEQLEKGEELQNYLYDFQDYKPISNFSIAALETLDCRNFQLNISQLKQEVILLRNVTFNRYE